jgi:hypothetical protein
MLRNRLGEMPCEALFDTNSVCPSGSAPTICAAATVAPPPGRFSTMTVCPSRAVSCSATMRATMSVVPPGAKGQTSRIVREGHARWPRAGSGSSAPAASRLRR